MNETSLSSAIYTLDEYLGQYLILLYRLKERTDTIVGAEDKRHEFNVNDFVQINKRFSNQMHTILKLIQENKLTSLEIRKTNENLRELEKDFYDIDKYYFMIKKEFQNKISMYHTSIKYQLFSLAEDIEMFGKKDAGNLSFRIKNDKENNPIIQFSDYFEFEDGSCWYIATTRCFVDLNKSKPGYTIYTNKNEYKNEAGTVFFDTMEQAIEAAKIKANEKKITAIPQTLDFWVQAIEKDKAIPIFTCVPENYAIPVLKRLFTNFMDGEK